MSLAPDRPPGSREPSGADRIRGMLSSFRALWRDLTGESAYDRYVLRHRLEHPGHEPMDERRFGRARIGFDEENVRPGCC